MTRQFLAFDIEIERPIPEGADDWKSHRPLGISCAATLTDDGKIRLWHGITPQGGIADALNLAQASALVDFLQANVQAGYTIVTWNGLGFDFDILAEESGRLDDCRALALEHVDMMFQFFCLKGYGLGLDRAAQGMGLPGKPAGMTGKLAPIYWAQGRRQEVLDYVAQDVHVILSLARKVELKRGLSWTSSQGRPQYLPLPGGWLNVQDSMTLPQPDVTWMRRPWSRRKFTGWLDL